MPKKKTSKKQEESSKRKSKAEPYRPGSDVSFEGLKDAMVEALFEEDYDTFKGCIAILIEKAGYQQLVKVTGLSKSTLYRMCEPTSNPTLENVGKIMSYIQSQVDTKAA
jgi:DNA-binding phage protein